MSDPSIKVAIVIVTYNRADFLEGLLKSIQASTVQPWRIIVVDNASTDGVTKSLLQAAGTWFGPEVLFPMFMTGNTGGAGGFHHGLKQAYEMGADWIWMMDDDVTVLPEGLAKLLHWGKSYQCLHGRRYEKDGTSYFWQPRISETLVQHLPYQKNPFAKGDAFPTNTGCFEGMFIHRDIVARIGFPDPRFFITWDDSTYGWLASKHTQAVYVDAFVLRRERSVPKANVGIATMRGGNDLYRFFHIRNRAIARKYMLKQGVAQSNLLYGLGTLFNVLKEVLRLVLVERQISLHSLMQLYRGWRASREILNDKDWLNTAPLDCYKRYLQYK